MKYLSALLPLVAMPWMIGCAQNLSMSDIAKACAESPQAFGNWVVAAPADVTSSLDANGWNKSAQPSPAKMRSEIDVLYRFSSTVSASTKQTAVQLRFSAVTSEPAVAYVYAVDEGKVMNHVNTVFVLKKGQTSQIDVHLEAPPQRGILAVATCQAGRKSIISIDFPKK